MPMDRNEFKIAVDRLGMTNTWRHLRQADKAAGNVRVTIAGVVLVFTYHGEDEVHYFDVPWLEAHVGTQIRAAVENQLKELREIEGK